ncbi:MAG: hypothetical protein ACKORF_02945 [Micrococcales bacterium]
MSQDPRLALAQFIAALERHLEASSAKRDPEDAAVDAAFFQLEDAFLSYQEALDESFGENLPFDLPEEE